MDKAAYIEQLKEVIGSLLKQRGIDLVDLIYRYEGGGLFLRALIDKPQGGITLGECSFLNNDIGNILDEKDVIQEKYILEVSSPGLDRPLATERDFLRCLNKQAKFFLLEAAGGKIEWQGTIQKLENGCVLIDAKGRPVLIPLSKIRKAVQLINGVSS